MSQWIDAKYLRLLQTQLSGFTWKTKDVANCKCFDCGDSATQKNKKRGYFFPGKNGYRYYCHNCQESKSMWIVLKELDHNLHKEYVLELYKEAGEGFRPQAPQVTPEPPKPVLEPRSLDLPRISDLSIGHYARMYLAGRKIPEKYFDILYYAEDFKDFVETTAPAMYEDTLWASESRIVIPFYDTQKNLIAFQGRSFSDHGLRYITIKMYPEAVKVFGMERFDFNKPGFVVEGPIDSLFLQNCLAGASGDIKTVEKLVDKKNTTYIVDNQPRNSHVVRQMEECVDLGYKVFVWPTKVKGKDINDLIKDEGMTPDQVLEMINTHTFRGLAAKQKITQWKRC